MLRSEDGLQGRAQDSPRGDAAVPVSVNNTGPLLVARLGGGAKLRYNYATHSDAACAVALPPATQQVTGDFSLDRPRQRHETLRHEPRRRARDVGAGLTRVLEERWGLLYAALDFVSAWAAVLLVSSVLQFSPKPVALFALPGLVVLSLFIIGAYRRRLQVQVLDWLIPVVGGVTVATMAVALAELQLTGQLSSPSLWLRVWTLAVIALCFCRAILTRVHRWARCRRLIAKPVIIVGAGVVGSRVARRLQASPDYGLLPVGFVDEDARSTINGGDYAVPVVGTVDAMEDALAETGARNVIVAFSSATDAQISALVRRCQELGVEVSVVPRMFETINDRITYGALGGLPLLTLRGVDPNGWQFAIKHMLDRVFAVLLLVVLSPIMAAAALAVRATSDGPILFRQRRVGRDGKTFDLYKFRSMHWRPSDSTPRADDRVVISHVDSDTGPGGVEGDNRLTRVGALLRKLSIDEFPQFINVLMGDMSLVGPRPERPEFVELFGRVIDGYEGRHRVKAGITGWAQVHGLRGPTSLVDRVEWDNYYITHWSLLLDLKIVLLTVVALFRGV